MTTLACAVRLPLVTTDLDELLRQVAQRDVDAFATFYDRTRARVFGMVTRVLRDPGYSEETTQDIYLQVWRTAGSYDPAAGSRWHGY
jgi:RNA polymerase sigma-70 factor (ECF subfamily)